MTAALECRPAQEACHDPKQTSCNHGPEPRGKLAIGMHNPLCDCVRSRICEQIERTEHLIRLIPPERSDWIPPIDGAWSTGLLLGHLQDCLAGFCAVLTAFEPDRLSHFAQLRSLPVNESCSPSEAITRIGMYREHISEGFVLLRDSDLARTISTMFSDEEQSLLGLLLGNLEHLVNHKHQLFTYLKLMGVRVTSEDLYLFSSGKSHPSCPEDASTP